MTKSLVFHISKQTPRFYFQKIDFFKNIVYTYNIIKSKKLYFVKII